MNNLNSKRTEQNRQRRFAPVSLLCRKAWTALKITAVVALIIAGIYALLWGDYQIWRVNHPGAPWWGYLLHN